MEVFVAFEPAAAYAQEGYPVPVFRVEVGMDLKDEAAEFILFCVEQPDGSLSAAWRGCDTDEGIEHFPHAEVVDGTPEKYGCYLALQVVFLDQLAMHAIHQFHVFPKYGGVLFAQSFLQKGTIEPVDLHHIIVRSLGIGHKEHQVLVVEVVDPFEILSAVDGPGHRVELYIQLFFNLFQQIEAVLSIPVHLIDEKDDGGVAHAANFHE